MTPTPGHVGRRRRRTQILDAALTITAEHGVNAVTIGALADRLHVTQPAIHSCFADRVEVVAALLHRETEILGAAVVRSLDAARGDTPEEMCMRGCEALLRVVWDRPQPWRVVFFGAPDQAVAIRFAWVRSHFGAGVAACLRSAMTSWWSVTGPDADAVLPILLEYVLSSCEAAIRSLLDADGYWSPHDLGELLGRMVCHALRRASQTPTIAAPFIVF